VRIGPLQPVCSSDKPCDGPARHVTLTFRRDDGTLLRRVVTDRTGGYRVLLRSGAYTVRASRGRSIRPKHVWVRRGLVARLDLAIDTGIR
jgi:hypothetical protein